MTSSVLETNPLARNVTITADELTISLADGRRISVPLAWYPRLIQATPAQLAKWEILGEGEGIRWPLIDEDLSVAGILLGAPARKAPLS